MRILLSNDDGVHAPALLEMHKELKKLGKVWVVAPLEEKSTAGHSLTLHKPLRLIEMHNGFYGVSGSPADCVYLGIREVIGSKPDVVISGINRGANLGQDVYYSGTVSAAREACMMGIPAFAVSLVIDYQKPKPEKKLNYASAAKTACRLIREFRDNKIQIPKDTLVNVNVPDLPFSKLKGTRLVRQGRRFYSGSILRRRDHRGKDYYWVGGQYKGFKKEVGTDTAATSKGYVSVSPLKLDTTSYHFLDYLKNVWPDR